MVDISYEVNTVYTLLIPADDAIDPYIGVWQVHTATFTIATAGGDYS